MTELNLFQRLLGRILSLFGNSATIAIHIRDSGETAQVKNGISFSELDELYGEGNWSL